AGRCVGGDRGWRGSRLRNILPPDDGPQSRRYFAPAPARIPSSSEPRRSLPDGAAQTALSDLPNSGRLDIRSCSAIRDIFGERGRGYAENLLPKSPTLRASVCDDTRRALPRSPR